MKNRANVWTRCVCVSNENKKVKIKSKNKQRGSIVLLFLYILRKQIESKEKAGEWPSSQLMRRESPFQKNK